MSIILMNINPQKENFHNYNLYGLKISGPKIRHLPTNHPLRRHNFVFLPTLKKLKLMNFNLLNTKVMFQLKNRPIILVLGPNYCRPTQKQSIWPISRHIRQISLYVQRRRPNTCRRWSCFRCQNKSVFENQIHIWDLSSTCCKTITFLVLRN